MLSCGQVVPNILYSPRHGSGATHFLATVVRISASARLAICMLKASRLCWQYLRLLWAGLRARVPQLALLLVMMTMNAMIATVCGCGRPVKGKDLSQPLLS